MISSVSHTPIIFMLEGEIMKCFALCIIFVILTLFLTSCNNDLSVSPISPLPMYTETTIIKSQSTTAQESEEDDEPAEIIESDNCFYPFLKNTCVRESVESVWEKVRETGKFRTSEEKFKISQSNGKLTYITDFDEDVIVYRHPDKVQVFTGISYGNQIGYITVTLDDLDVYSIDASRILDIFAYGDYVYYIHIGQHGFSGGIKRLVYTDRWVDDLDFNTNAEVAQLSYAVNSKYGTIKKAYVSEDDVYIISSTHIYLFDGENLTPIFKRGISSYFHSVTKIGDSFYIGSTGYIIEHNIATGEEYVWTIEE